MSTTNLNRARRVSAGLQQHLYLRNRARSGARNRLRRYKHRQTNTCNGANTAKQTHAMVQTPPNKYMQWYKPHQTNTCNGTNPTKQTHAMVHEHKAQHKNTFPSGLPRDMQWCMNTKRNTETHFPSGLPRDMQWCMKHKAQHRNTFRLRPWEHFLATLPSGGQLHLSRDGWLVSCVAIMTILAFTPRVYHEIQKMRFRLTIEL